MCYSKFLLDCPVRFAPYILVAKFSKAWPQHLLLWKNDTLHLAGGLHKPRMDMKNRDIWSQNLDVTEEPKYKPDNSNEFAVVLGHVEFVSRCTSYKDRFLELLAAEYASAMQPTWFHWVVCLIIACLFS